MQLLSELMSSPASPPHTSTPHSKIIREKSTGESVWPSFCSISLPLLTVLPLLTAALISEVVQGSKAKEGNIRQLVACVKKLYGEKKQLKQQVATFDLSSAAGSYCPTLSPGE